jgi:hypothetical protein
VGRARLLLSAAAALAFPTALAAQPQPPEPAQLVRIELVGASVYTPERVSRIIRLEAGKRLWRDAASAARALEDRYHADGYVGARVGGAFADGVLTLTVDEGPLDEVVVEGLAGAAGRRALRSLALPTGRPVRDRDVLDALARLEDDSQGAVRAKGLDPFRIEERPEGGRRVVVDVESPPGRVSIGLEQPGPLPLYGRIDGLAPGAGVELVLHDRRRYDHLSLYARGAYGFASERGRFAAGARRPFGPLTLGYEFHDLTDSDDVFRATGVEETLGTLLFGSSFRDAYARRGHEAYAFASLGRAAQLGLSYRSDRYGSLDVGEDWSLFRNGATPRPNPPVAEGAMRSLVASARWSSQELFADRGDEGQSLLLPSLYGTGNAPEDGLRAEASLEVASPDLGGDFDFRRLIAHLRGRRIVSSRFAIAGRVLLGVTGGAPPPQRRFALGGLGTLRGRHFKEYAGDHMLLASVEGTRRATFPWPSPVLFYDGGTVWGEGAPDPGWKSDLGLGLEWSVAGRVGLRIDGAFPVEPEPGRDAFRLTLRLTAPF